MNALNKKLDEFKGRWAEIVSVVLWANRTIEKEATGESPFKLAFGVEAMLPVEVGLPSYSPIGLSIRSMTEGKFGFSS